MSSIDAAREALKRFLARAEEEKFDYGFLGRLNSAGTEYEFKIPTKPGLVYCQVQRGLAVEHAECVPRVALNPYVRCKFKTVRGVLVAFEFDPLDGVTAYGFESGGLDLPAFPMPEWGALPPPPMFGDPVVKLLHAGVASAGKDRHLRLAAESGTADDCDGLTGLAVGDEAWLFADTGDTITLKHNSGSVTDKFQFYNEADIVITGAKGLRVLKRASGAIVNSADELGTSAFTALTDTFSDYTGLAGKYIKVNATEDGLDTGTPSGSSGAPDYILLREEQAQNTAGGTFTSGSWQTRVLNTEVEDAGGHCTLSSNQFTLPAGTYRVYITCPAIQVGSHAARLYNISDSAVTLLGSSDFSLSSGTYVVSRSVIAGRFTIAGTKTFEVQHSCQTTCNTFGFGRAGLQQTEIYTICELWKEA